LEYVAKPVVIAKGVTNRVKLNQLDASQGPKMPVVKELSDVLSEELPVMPPNHDIEFAIELVPILLLCIRDPIGWMLSN
jgi:hypothetical protein